MNQIDLFINGLLNYAEDKKHTPKMEKGHKHFIINIMIIFYVKIPKIIFFSTVNHTQIKNTLHKNNDLKIKLFLLKYCTIYSLL